MTRHCATPLPRVRAIAFAIVFTFLGGVRGHAATYNIADGDVAGLIAAINAANASGVSNVINLAAGGTYTLTLPVEDDGYAGPAGLPYIRSALTIEGHGATIQRSSAAGTPDFRIVFVFVTDLVLNDITITGGRGGNPSRGGGGVGITTGHLVVTNSTIAGNTSLSDGGGGIASYCGAVTIVNSTIAYNIAYGGRAGGGVLNFSAPAACFATLTIISSTIFENQTPDQNLGGRGDAIADAFSGAQPTIVLKNSIIASPTLGVGDDCNVPPGVIVSLGHNIASDASCGLVGAGDLNSTDPLLGPLTNNGGTTATASPLPGSPALDAVPAAFCTDANGAPLTVDQRGVTRPQGAACDIGAVEVIPRRYDICLLYDSGKAVRSGSTIPVKLQLCDDAGNDMSSASVTLTATSVTQVSTSISGAVQDAGDANPDDNFRYDPALGSAGGYIFNLSTKGMTTGTYALNFTVSGETYSYAAVFQVK